MVIDALLLSRIQFAFTIGFHILFPTLNLGLAVFLSIMEGLWIITKDPDYKGICKFWIKIFALTFGMGIVSGVVLSYELGTNFSGYTKAVGGVLGALFTYEVLSAFFLEAGFLGIMLFGWEKVGNKLHYIATLLVTLGTTISAFWIISANSWMQTPSGYQVINHVFVVKNWWQVVFNPSFILRFIHMLLASYVTTCFLIAGVSAWHLLKKQHEKIAKRCFSFVLGAAMITVPLQVAVGDMVGLQLRHYQPIKIAAIEGLWKTQKAVPFVIFGIPNQQQEKNNYEVGIPYGASLINTHSLTGELTGLTAVPKEERPFVAPIFFSFRVMVGIGFLFLFTALYSTYLRWQNKLFHSPLFYRWCILISPLGFVSAIAGWLTAELGRQPWTVYNKLRTIDSVSLVPTSNVALSLSLFIIIYTLIFSFYLFYLFKLIQKGPEISESSPLEIPKDPFASFQYMTKKPRKFKKDN
jgi:cytochrome d ubiquinol oxidase subunit I